MLDLKFDAMGRKMLASLAQVAKPVSLYGRYIGSNLLDAWLGITTTDEAAAYEFGLDRTQYLKIHRALPFIGLWRLLHYLNPGKKNALLDVGCGVGRVICLAAQYPLSRVIGIDIDEKCCSLAKQNARNLRRRFARPEIECTDSANYRIPDCITIIVFYNSFGGDALREMLERVLESYNRSPRRIRLVYANPKEHDLIVSTGRFRETGQFWMSWRPGAEWGRTQMIRFYEVEA